MKRICFIIILTLVSLITPAQNLEGKWFFESIRLENDSSNKDLKPISKKDFLFIGTNGTFEYEISKISLFASGKWSLDDNILVFNYNQPSDTSREYKITINSNQLLLNESGVNYKFQKVIINSELEKSEFKFKNLGRGLLGLITLILIAFLFSKNRKNIDWHLVWKGLLIQIVFAILILKVPIIQNGFEWISSVFVTILGFTREGSIFLFGDIISNTDSFGFIFAFQVLPTIIFFSALTSLLFYFGILQKLVYVFAVFMKKIMNLSGSESLAAAGNIFLGQTESPLLIKPYIDKMTMSELLCLMSGGMATIAGGVLAAYIGFLGGNDPVQQLFFAKHLLAASVMSAPAAVVASKILLPEKEEVNQTMEISDEQIGANALEAISIGTTQGIKLAVNVGAMLLVFIAFITMANYFLRDYFGDFTGLNNWVNSITNGQYDGLTLEFLLGYTLAPITWIMGVCKQDMVLVGQLLGEKTILNEFVAYVSLGEMKASGKFFEEKSIIIATYILCGFANFASIGIQIGGIGALAPKRRTDLSKLGILALIAGTLACLFTAVIVGMIL
ncbi:MAG: nucleoside transporter C-terminal domain-containing protein [Flavobacteriales bacterium]|jgi:concentrative nucleoside transporter, CNT family|nr:nucleoside transporter C-terminal domain-containing protein [Flavobacteriales bacterium]MDG1934377.1 nucleoside transporter C-terminal domain-containing protein [Flavobacteriales bacterium]MDG2086965.1 nucleoside transporter C-terminal domain-containing protein [Flavobacteriales bacterium]